MNDNVVAFDFKKTEHSSVQSLLDSCNETGFDRLFVIGLKGDLIHMGTSEYESSIEIVGLLEFLKHHVVTDK